MSVLAFPRINFRGIFRTNPCTSNNDDVMPAVVNRDSDTLGGTLTGMTDAQIEAYLREQVSMSNQPNGGCVNFIRAGWNLYGDFSTSFEEAVITSVVYGPDPSQRITTPGQDSLVGQPVQLLGSVTNDPARRGSAMICDLDPTGLVTTQLWVGGLQIGDLVFDHDTRAFQNWLNFASTVGTYTGEQNFVGIGCSWQFAIPVTAFPVNTATIASPGLQALLRAAGGAAGLVVRFRSFEVQPELRDEEMYAQFEQGQAIDNPALGYLVGTIGIWEEGEPATEVAGRKLTVPYPRAAMAWQSPDGQSSGGMPPASQPWGAAPAMIGNAVACVQDAAAVISMDLVGTFPKFGFRDPDGPGVPSARGFAAPKQMANVGTVELGVVPVTGGPALPIATIDYGLTDYSTYEDFGGIVDLPFNPQLSSVIAEGMLVVQATTAPNVDVRLLEETTLRVVTDDRTMYLLPGTTSAPLRIKVYDRGGPTKSDTLLQLFENRNVILPQSNSTCAAGVRPNQTVVQPGNQGNPRILSCPATVTIPAGQGFAEWYPIDISPIGSGTTLLSFETNPTMFPSGSGGTVVGVPGWSTATYSAIRVYPDDNFSALYENGTVQWPEVYENALRYYYVLFPAMSRFIPLNYPDFLVAQADIIKQRLSTPSDPGFWTTYNMPPTRTMSPGKVKLILDFINQQQLAKQRQTT